MSSNNVEVVQDVFFNKTEMDQVYEKNIYLLNTQLNNCGKSNCEECANIFASFYPSSMIQIPSSMIQLKSPKKK